LGAKDVYSVEHGDTPLESRSDSLNDQFAVGGCGGVGVLSVTIRSLSTTLISPRRLRELAKFAILAG